jgi:hypothetical protein
MAANWTKFTRLDWPVVAASCLPMAPPLEQTLAEAQIISSASVASIDNIILLLLA